MTPKDVAGLVGVVIILAAYTAVTFGKLDPRKGVALSANLLGASLVLFSLVTEKFNLSATVLEGAWALVALAGLVRLGLLRRSR